MLRYTQRTTDLLIDDDSQDGDEVDFFNRGQIFRGIAANEKEFGQKRAKCVKLEKCAGTPGSAHLGKVSKTHLGNLSVNGATPPRLRKSF